MEDTKDMVDYYVNRYKMDKHPEGGYYVKVHRSTEKVTKHELLEQPESRQALGSIHFLLAGEQFSAFHRIKFDELFHYEDGAACKITIIHQDGSLEVLKCGHPLKHKDTEFQQVVPRNVWFTIENEDKSSFSLVGSTTGTAFEFEDFELGSKKQLLELYPQHKDLIERLTILE